MADIPANATTKAELEGSAGAGAFSGALETPGDHDWIKVELDGGTTYRFYLSFLNTGSVTLGDSFLTLRDANGNEVLSDDDGGVGFNSFLSYTPPGALTQTFFIDVSELGGDNMGTYSLVTEGFAGTTNAELSDGNDIFTGLANQVILGGKGADTITIGGGISAFGEQGNDILIGNASLNHISGGLGDDWIDGGGGTDALFGDAGNDVIFGGDGSDEIIAGGAGNDFLDGGAGAFDGIAGGLGKDYLTGGPGSDGFVFLTLADSKKGANRDVIQDFSQAEGDMILVDDIDAKSNKAGNQDFTFIKQAKFHDKVGELRYVKQDLAGSLNDKTIIQGDVNGDGRADFEIQLTGLYALTSGDFDL